MAMTRTRYRKQTTLTFLTEQLVAVDQELELLRRNAPSDAPAVPGLLRSLEARRLALVAALRQFDPELDVGAIAAVAASESAVAVDVAEEGGHG